MAQENRLLRLPEVMEKTGMSKAAVYRRIKDSDFPPPVRIGPRMSAWKLSDVDAWIASLEVRPAQPSGAV